ncbi:MAG TPA: RibD family protein, partial [Thermoanaerobaculia bacterium]|nr:RibD family protein [Thermoanaerobaculia bacterium]
ECDAVLVGAGTVTADDPALTRRLGLNRSILPHRRIVLEGSRSVPASARVFDPSPDAEAWLVTARPSDDPILDAFRARGVRVESLPAASARVDLNALLSLLFAREVRSVLVEGGAATAGSFLDARLVDRVTAFVAPRLFGGGTAAIAGVGVALPSESIALADLEVEPVGGDLRITARVAG